MKKFCIIGAGWYGCHIGLFLKDKGHEVTILEKNKNIFLGSSGYNQFRLHKGFHYPRSSQTISEVIKNFKKFYNKYRKFVYFPKNNYYCIAKKKSLIDTLTYEIIFKSHKIKFKKKYNKHFKNVEGTYTVNEGVIKNNKIINFYKKKLKKNIFFNKKILDIKKIQKKFDYVLDCTNHTFLKKSGNNFNYVLTISAVYKKKPKKNVFPITIMDGKLPSLYPYSDQKNFYTLTHSKYTHIKKFKSFKELENFKSQITKKEIKKITKKMENSIIKYYPDFSKNFKYQKYFFSYKVLPREKTDKRSTIILKKENVISCTSPKISNIFTFQDYVAKLL